MTRTKEIRGPALSVKKAEFGGAVLFGAIMVIGSVVVMGAWSHFEMKRQTRTFLLATSSLAEEPGIAPFTQREAMLLKKDDVYHWRALLWRNDPSGKTPLIWSVKVRDNPEEVFDFQLTPYDPMLAEELELPRLPAAAN